MAFHYIPVLFFGKPDRFPRDPPPGDGRRKGMRVMKLHVKKNMDHFVKDMFADILRAQSLMTSEVEYEGLFQIVAAELRAAKYCWDELYKRSEDPSEKILANEHEIGLRAKIASLMHAANVLVEAEHMIEQKYPLPSTAHIRDLTLAEVRRDFEALNDVIDKMLHSRDLYKVNKILRDFFVLWDGGRHMHAFD
jgi:hypothetical protein